LLLPGLPGFSRYNRPKRGKIYKMITKFTQIGIFSLKIYHLATLATAEFTCPAMWPVTCLTIFIMLWSNSCNSCEEIAVFY
jgi:hypothetical protein